MIDFQLFASGFAGGALALICYSIGGLIGDIRRRRRNKEKPIE